MNDILFGNNNSKVITKLSKRYFKKNKVRNLAALLAIILTAFLFTSVTSLAFNMASSIQLSLQIYEAIWRKDSEHCGTAVASVIGQIRRKLTPDTPKGGYIRTVLGSGYKFNSSPF